MKEDTRPNILELQEDHFSIQAEDCGLHDNPNAARNALPDFLKNGQIRNFEDQFDILPLHVDVAEPETNRTREEEVQIPSESQLVVAREQHATVHRLRSEERRVGKECRSWWSP